MNITYDYENKIILVSDEEDNILGTYADATAYLAEHPEREADCKAIGWVDAAVSTQVQDV